MTENSHGTFYRTPTTVAYRLRHELKFTAAEVTQILSTGMGLAPVAVARALRNGAGLSVDAIEEMLGIVVDLPPEAVVAALEQAGIAVPID